MGLVIALGLLAVTLAAAIASPRRLNEATVAVPAAALCILGPLDAAAARDELEAIGPTLGLLAAVLALGRLCAQEGLFVWAGAAMSKAAGADPRRLLAWVLLVGTAFTTVLSLDATVVLFTPVVMAAAVRAAVPARAHLHATVHLQPAPRFAFGVLGATLIGLIASSPLHIEPAWFAGVGAAVLALPRLARGGLSAGELVRWCEPGFLLFVAALTVVVRTATQEGLGDDVDGLVDRPDTFAGLLAIATVGGLATVPIALVGATAALWASLQVVGG